MIPNSSSPLFAGPVAALYPGQGSQYVGMGRALHEALPIVRETYEEAASTLGWDLRPVSFEGPDAALVQTAAAQPTIFVLSFAIWRVLEAEGWRSVAVAGHSLGEYTALAAAGAMSFPDALRAVAERGAAMQAACDALPGTMAAVLGLEMERLETLCLEATEAGPVEMANVNAPGQIILSGSHAGVERAGELAREAGARRIVPLSVGGAFHSSLMAPAAVRMAGVLREVAIHRPRVAFVANVTGELAEEPEAIRELLVRQITEPVLWGASVERLAALGVGAFAEVGPGKVLTNLVRRIRADLSAVALGDLDALEAAGVAVRVEEA